MRHRHSGRQLNRNSPHRTAMFRNMTASLVEHEIIRTTLVKAKELRSVAEPLITLAKNDSVANRRLAFSRTATKRQWVSCSMSSGLAMQIGPADISGSSNAENGRATKRRWLTSSWLIGRSLIPPITRTKRRLLKKNRRGLLR